MEDDLNFFKMEDNLNFFSKMEDDLIFFQNGRQPKKSKIRVSKNKLGLSCAKLRIN
jgi:hypothetical protein